MTDTETLSKLYLELAHVVPEGTKTYREMALEEALKFLVNCCDAAEFTGDLDAGMDGEGPVESARALLSPNSNGKRDSKGGGA